MKKTLGTMVAIMLVAIIIGTFITAKHASAGETARDGRFIAYDDGTVLDTKTNLMWATKDNGADIKLQGAKSYCEAYRGGGYTDWRMPTQLELEGLHDGSVKGHNEYYLTTLITLTGCCPWGTAERLSRPANFGFNVGNRRWGSQTGAVSNRAFPVRSGK
jgi:hypothetical protein